MNKLERSATPRVRLDASAMKANKLAPPYGCGPGEAEWSRRNSQGKNCLFTFLFVCLIRAQPVQLPTLANICAKFEQNLESSYRETKRTKLFVYMVSHIPDIDKALAMLMWEAQLFTICAMCEQNPTSSYREIHRTKLFVYICHFITHTDTALVVPTRAWGAAV